MFNRRHKGVGHLFQNRYKSIVCDGNAYLLELARYIHLNPFRAGFIETSESLKDDPWYRHRELLAGASRLLIAGNNILPLFSKQPKAVGQKGSLTELIDLVATYYGIEKLRLSQPSKMRSLSQAKAVIFYVAIRHLDLKGIDVARKLAPAAVSHAASRGAYL